MAKQTKKTPPNLSGFEMDSYSKFYSDNFRRGAEGFSGDTITHIPNVDMYSTPTELVIEVELPGARREDIEVMVHGETLTVKAVKFECFDDDKINYVCMERVFGLLFRAIEIPFPVNASLIKAAYDNGVLTVTVPRIEEKRSGSRRIEIG